MSKGFIIEFEGVDGCGKTTQIEKLKDYFTSIGRSFTILKFPTENHVSSKLARAYLNQEIDSESFNGYQAEMFYIVDFICHAKTIREALNRGDVVIIDRYIGTAYTHQTIRDFDPGNKFFYNYMLKYIENIDEIAYNVLDLPEPDLVLYFSISPGCVEARRKNDLSRAGDYHENNEEMMRRIYHSGLTAASIKNWDIVDCDDKTIDQIHAEVIKIVKDYHL